MDADAIVIGAGAAGLAAARRLASRSLRAIVVEARDRVGGRVFSSALPGVRPPAELGAEYIHGAAKETRALLREMGASTTEVDGDSWTCSESGELQSQELDFRSAAAIFEKACSLERDESVDAFLGRFAGDASARPALEMARAFVEGFDAADPALASVRAVAEEWTSGTDGEIARPLGGYAPMFEYLRETCVAAGAQLLLSTTVRRIAWRHGDVAIETTDASGGSRTLRARAAIVTLPLGVLRHAGDDSAVVFDPGLPATKHDALGHLEVGHVFRVALWFRTQFWREMRGGRYRDTSFFRCPRLPFPAYWTQIPERSELVVAWVGGPAAIALDGASESTLIQRAADGFGEMFGEPELVRREFVGGLMHDWWHDRYARGAYSYVLVGGEHARASLSAPLDDTLFFAGEATSTDGQGGTVNGALETGERAAREASLVL